MATSAARPLVIGCGALARELVALTRRAGFPEVDLTCLPATLHNRPERIPALVSRTPEGIRVTASLPMDLRHYQIEGLTRFLIFKMKPEIVVHVDVMFGY